MPEYRNIKCMIFPDDTFKTIWDGIIMIVMVYTISITPYRVAFVEADAIEWESIDYGIDIIFGLDVIFNCLMAFTHEETLIISRCKIISVYAKSWMLPDILSSLPYQLIVDNSHWSAFIRLSKLPRLYRLIKIIKLVRLVKILKNRNQIMKIFQCFSKLSVGMERLMYFLICFLTICHLIACILYFVSSFNNDNVNNWVFRYGIIDETIEEKYLASVYWTVTTLCTIGYGDILPASDIERGVVIFVELAGVFIYSYTIGTITSLMAEMDKRQSKLDAKISVLQELTKKYNISKKFYEKLKSALEYNQSMINRERAEMISYLPKKLAMQLNIVMNKALIDKNKFFRGKQLKFVTSVIDYLKPLKVKPREIIFRKGEFTEEMFFIKVGEVLLYELHLEIDIIYETLTEGDYFGDVEIFLSDVRETSAKASKISELYTLSREDLFTNILMYFKDLKLSMIIDANERREKLTKKKEEMRSNYLQLNNFPSGPSNPSDTLKDIQRMHSPTYHRSEYAHLRKTLAPTTRAMLEENDDASIDELQGEIMRLNLMIQELEDNIYKNDSKNIDLSVENVDEN